MTYHSTGTARFVQTKSVTPSYPQTGKYHRQFGKKWFPKRTSRPVWLPSHGLPQNGPEINHRFAGTITKNSATAIFIYLDSEGSHEIAPITVVERTLFLTYRAQGVVSRCVSIMRALPAIFSILLVVLTIGTFAATLPPLTSAFSAPAVVDSTYYLTERPEGHCLSLRNLWGGIRWRYCFSSIPQTPLYLWSDLWFPDNFACGCTSTGTSGLGCGAFHPTTIAEPANVTIRDLAKDEIFTVPVRSIHHNMSEFLPDDQGIVKFHSEEVFRFNLDPADYPDGMPRNISLAVHFQDAPSWYLRPQMSWVSPDFMFPTNFFQIAWGLCGASTPSLILILGHSFQSCLLSS